MRIISGKYKSRILKTDDLKMLRPATDRYRETLFNILQNFIDLNGKTVCDIYAGTGAIGFECISRGAEIAFFVEKLRATSKLIKENGDLLNVSGQINIINSDAEFFIKTTTEKFDLIFADPPYPDEGIYPAFEMLKSRKILKKEGLLLIQRGKRTLEKDKMVFAKEPCRIIGGDVLFLFEEHEL